ncbi:hypothetical protein N0V83_009442 [Neocucurbitaria cava]|uniref:Alcohol dehydrogenase-like C-terminal domain-containing protein n=1 Tax=Neocucurbitaria cava TaxID=798079 RepID=A0A9W8Y2Q1_9PLEO|nr:hypothetical protein N0V83_009442 [Neocucurbitaria cava]
MGLFEPAHIGLDPPTVALAGKNNQKNKDKAILIWGGSSTVGGCAVQLCAPVGLTVLAIASSKNHQYVKELGVVDAYDAIWNEETAQKFAEFLHAFGGGPLFATRASEFAPEQTLLGDVRRIAGHPPSRTEKGELPVWMKVWAEFMGEGLKSLKTGTLKAKPNPIIIKGGLKKL